MKSPTQKKVRKVKDEKYLADNLGLIKASICGTLMGIQMGGNPHYGADRVMEMIEKDVRRIFRYARRSINTK